MVDACCPFSLSLTPPSLHSPDCVLQAIDETSAMPMCDEPGACAVATWSSMAPHDLARMIQTAVLAEAGRAAADILRQVSQLHRIVREWETEQGSMVGVADDTKHVRTGILALFFPPGDLSVFLTAEVGGPGGGGALFDISGAW